MATILANKERGSDGGKKQQPQNLNNWQDSMNYETGIDLYYGNGEITPR